MRNLTLTAALILCLPLSAWAGESWTIEVGPDQWADNPACTGQCAQDREAARQPEKPKPGAPIQIEEEPKGKPARVADKSDRDPAPMQTAPGYYCRLNGEVVNYREATKHTRPPKDSRTVTRVCPWYAHKVTRSGGVPGLFGPHEGASDG